LGIYKITQIVEKISIKSLFILLKNAKTVVQKTPRKNVTSTILIFSSFYFYLFIYWLDVIGGKITIILKELH